MKLSLVFELLLIFVLLAFAASKNLGRKKNIKTGIQNKNSDIKAEDNSINRYCKCSELYCNCCRDFQVPLVNLSGAGCATLMYLNDDKMSVSLSFGRKVITNRTLSSRKPSPVCMPLPGGISKFCGRVYNIARAGEEFRACLGLELQSKSTVEAAVRVSCFKFGPRGVTSEPADPLPLVPQNENPDEEDDEYEDDDDDDDDFGLGGDDEYEEAEDDDDDGGELDAVNDVDSADYTGFSLLGEDLLGGLFGSGGKKSNKNKKKQAPTLPPSTTTRRPRPTRRPTRRPSSRVTTVRPSVTRTTTVRVRPITRRPTRRPTRQPNRRPSRRPPTSTETSTIPTTKLTTSVSDNIPPKDEENKPIISADTTNQETPVITEKMSSIQTLTTSKPETTFEDPSLELSLAHITGQLSVMPMTSVVNNMEEKNQGTTSHEVLYEKIETVTPKNPSTLAFVPTENIQDDMIQIVQNLDSHSEELVPNQGSYSSGQTRSHKIKDNSVLNNYYEGLALPKQNQGGSDFRLVDLDVLDLSKIGETVGQQLGIFGGNKRQNKNKDLKHGAGNRNNKDYDDVIGDLSETIGLTERVDNTNRRNRRRQNKMMRGEWSQA